MATINEQRVAQALSLAINKHAGAPQALNEGLKFPDCNRRPRGVVIC